MIFAISDVVYQALIAAVLAAFLEWIRRTTVKKVEDVKIVAEKAAEKVENVKIVAEKAVEKVEEVKKVVADQIMSKQLKIGMIAAQTLAATTPTEVNMQLAKMATDKYESHLATEKEQKLSAVPPA